MKMITNSQGHTMHYLRNENEFMLNYVPYEYDTVNKRHYFFEPSTSMTSRAGREGALVRRRISKEEFELARAECIVRLAVSDEVPALSAGELRHHVAADVLRYRADRIDGTEPMLGAMLPCVDAEGMIGDYIAEQSSEAAAPLSGIDHSVAANRVHGFLDALRALELIEPAQLHTAFLSQEKPPENRAAASITKAEDKAMQIAPDSIYDRADQFLRSLICSAHELSLNHPEDAEDRNVHECLLYLAKLNQREGQIAASKHYSELMELARMLETDYVYFEVDMASANTFTVSVFDVVQRKLVAVLTFRPSFEQHRFYLDQYKPF